jgi:hypothetical protein
MVKRLAQVPSVVIYHISLFITLVASNSPSPFLCLGNEYLVDAEFELVVPLAESMKICFEGALIRLPSEYQLSQGSVAVRRGAGQDTRQRYPTYLQQVYMLMLIFKNLVLGFCCPLQPGPSRYVGLDHALLGYQ